MNGASKICLLSDFAVGKTSLIQQAVYGNFSDHYDTTVGVTLERQQRPDGDLVLWDVAGSKQFDPLHERYLTGAKVCVLVVDVTRAPTLLAAQTLFTASRNLFPELVFVVAMNKCDRKSERELERKMVLDAGFDETDIFECSAKVSDDVDALFDHLAEICHR